MQLYSSLILEHQNIALMGGNNMYIVYMVHRELPDSPPISHFGREEGNFLQ